MKHLLVLLLSSLLFLGPSEAMAKRISRTMQFGEDTRVEGNGNVSIRAQCIQNENGSGKDVLRIYAATNGDRSVMDGIDELLGDGAYLTAATPAVDSQMIVVSADTGVEQISHGQDEGIVLSLNTLKGLALSAESSLLGLNVSDMYDCLFSIQVDKVKNFKHAREK